MQITSHRCVEQQAFPGWYWNDYVLRADTEEEFHVVYDNRLRTANCIECRSTTCAHARHVQKQWDNVGV